MKRSNRHLSIPNNLLLCVIIFSLPFLTAANSNATDPSDGYPSRLIELVVHSGPGGSNDVMGRLVSDITAKGKILSQPMVVVNKVGSGGAIAQGYVFERKGNPHVILVASATFITTPLLEKLPYTHKAFTPIANMAVEGSVLVVRSDSPFKKVDDIIAEARKRPKELIQGGGSFSGTDSLMGLTIQKLKGVKWNFISFAGGGTEAILNLLSGNIHFAFANPQPVLDYVRAGKMRVLLSGTPNRYLEFKDIPTMKEAGLGEPLVSYRGMVGPPNMPDYAVKKLEAVFKKVLDTDRFKKYIRDVTMQPFWLSSQEYGKFLNEESDRWKVVLSEGDLLKNK